MKFATSKGLHFAPTSQCRILAYGKHCGTINWPDTKPQDSASRSLKSYVTKHTRIKKHPKCHMAAGDKIIQTGKVLR